MSETLQVIQKLKNFEIKYFIDWGGGLIWASFDQLNTKILSEIRDTVKKHQGYITLIKVEEDLKASADIFTICLLYTSPSPRDGLLSRMPSSA